jgi:hypothetical protein
MFKIFICCMLASNAIICTSCYRMPTEDDFCVVPATNNPAVTREKPQGLVPQVSY